MKEKVVIPGSPKAWLLAMRPKTLSGAAVPVMIALALSYATTGAAQFKALPAVLCVLFALIMQIDANFLNDYFDFMRASGLVGHAPKDGFRPAPCCGPLF